jgi:histidine decarboxylase
MERALNKEDFDLLPEGLSEDQRKEALGKFDEYIAEQKSNFLGFQANQALHYEDEIAKYLDCQINNLGDPYEEGSFTINSKMMEQAVLDYFAKLWNVEPHNPDDSESCWGYVLSMGSSEANLYGLWNARDYLAGKFLLGSTEEETRKASLAGGSVRVESAPRVLRVTGFQETNALSPVLFYSEDTHYSIVKSAIVLRLKTFHEIGNEKYPGKCPLKDSNGNWPRAVPSEEGAEGPGSIDIDKLATLVEFFASENYPILINFNYGTTFKGAYDNIEAAGERIVPILEKHGLHERKVHYDIRDQEQYDIRNGFWFHVDGALGAAYMPFIERAYDEGLVDRRGPAFDFRLPFVHSISMSGHKWIGAPWPCGIYMTKRKYQLLPPDNPEYVGALDSTFAGSRNGLSALILWNYLAKTSYRKQTQKALYTQRMADYAYRRLKHLEKTLSKELWVARSPLSLTVRFKQVTPDLISKYSLSGETFYVNGKKRAYNHLFAMAHINEETIDRLIEDLSKPGAFPKQNVMPIP